MKKIIYLLLLFPIVGNAQLKLVGKVLDANTKQSIAYVNLENFKIQSGTQTNQDGVFELNMSKGKKTDTIKISCVGYEDKYITNLQSNENVVYELLPVIFQLNEVKVSNKKPVEIEVGVINNKGKNYKPFNYVFQRSGTQRAVFMENVKGKTSYLKSLNFYMGKDLFEAPFRVRIYANDNGLPGKDMLNKTIEFIGKKQNSWNELNMVDYFFEVPEDGFFVAVEWIANDKYKRETEFLVTSKTKGGSTEKRMSKYYGPEIIVKFDTHLGITYYKSLGGKWIKEKGSITKVLKPRDVSIDLLVKATLTVYN